MSEKPVCPRCGAEVNPENVCCTKCGYRYSEDLRKPPTPQVTRHRRNPASATDAQEDVERADAPTNRPKRRSPILAIVLVLVLLAGVGVGAFAFLNMNSSSTQKAAPTQVDEAEETQQTEKAEEETQDQEQESTAAEDNATSEWNSYTGTTSNGWTVYWASAGDEEALLRSILLLQDKSGNTHYFVGRLKDDHNEHIAYFTDTLTSTFIRCAYNEDEPFDWDFSISAYAIGTVSLEQCAYSEMTQAAASAGLAIPTLLPKEAQSWEAYSSTWEDETTWDSGHSWVGTNTQNNKEYLLYLSPKNNIGYFGLSSGDGNQGTDWHEGPIFWSSANNKNEQLILDAAESDDGVAYTGYYHYLPYTISSDSKTIKVSDTLSLTLVENTAS